jgi:hypothetical protein
MNINALGTLDLLGMLVGFLLTLLIFSYIFGDNVLFRLGIHIFIGISTGYIAVLVWENVLWARLFAPLISGSQSERILAIVPLVLGVLLLMKASPRLSGLGNISMAFLVGVGAAAAVGGAVLGTIFPQAAATINQFDLDAMRQSGENVWLQLFNAIVMIVGTLATLIYFQFSVRSKNSPLPGRARWIEMAAWVGRIFIAITFGVLFAGVYAASLAALVERLGFMANLILSFFMPAS